MPSAAAAQVRAGLRERRAPPRRPWARAASDDLELRGRQLGLEARVAVDARQDLARPRRQVERLGVEEHELLLDAHRHGRVRLEGGAKRSAGAREQAAGDRLGTADSYRAMRLFTLPGVFRPLV